MQGAPELAVELHHSNPAILTTSTLCSALRVFVRVHGQRSSAHLLLAAAHSGFMLGRFTTEIHCTKNREMMSDDGNMDGGTETMGECSV